MLKNLCIFTKNGKIVKNEKNDQFLVADFNFENVTYAKNRAEKNGYEVLTQNEKGENSVFVLVCKKRPDFWLFSQPKNDGTFFLTCENDNEVFATTEKSYFEKILAENYTGNGSFESPVFDAEKSLFPLLKKCEYEKSDFEIIELKF